MEARAAGRAMLRPGGRPDSTFNSPQLSKSTPMGPGRAVQPPQSALDSGTVGPDTPVPRCRGAVLQALASWRNLAPPLRLGLAYRFEPIFLIRERSERSDF
jgi:hypothetical protein